MAIWPFRSKPQRQPRPQLQDGALAGLSQMFLQDEQNPTPGSELLDVSRFDFTVSSLGALDEHLELMRARGLDEQELATLVLRAGAYAGEVIRRHAPPPKEWHWLDYDQAAAIDPRLASLGKELGTIAVLWDGDGGFTFPLSKVGKFLENGPEDSVRFFAEVIIADSPADA